MNSSSVSLSDVSVLETPDRSTVDGCSLTQGVDDTGSGKATEGISPPATGVSGTQGGLWLLYISSATFISTFLAHAPPWVTLTVPGTMLKTLSLNSVAQVSIS